MPEKYVRFFAYEIIGQIYYLQQKGIYHPDISPFSFFLTESFTPMITYFDNVAQLSKESTDFGAGMIGFRSPEKMYTDEDGNMRPYDQLKDNVFSLGCTLIHIHAGRTPLKLDP